MTGFLERLVAEGPDPAYGERLDLYGRLVGAWHVDGCAWDARGARQRWTGTWHFAWVLDGLAVQDVLTLTRLDDGGAPTQETGSGTSLRAYDARADVWYVFWAGPSAGEFNVLVGRAKGDRIVQEGVWTDDDRRPYRWTFSEVTDRAFVWQGFVSDDGGETYRLVQEMRCTRRIPSAMGDSAGATAGERGAR